MPFVPDTPIATGRFVPDGGGEPAAATPARWQDELLGGLMKWGHVGAGVYRGVRDVTDTLLGAATSGIDRVAGTNLRPSADRAATAALEEYDAQHGQSNLAGAGRLAGNVAATLPVGGALAAPLRGVAPRLAEAVATSGFRAGGAGMATRGVGGAATGGASAGLVNPDDATTGAAVGAALPPALRAAGAAGGATARAVRGMMPPAASPEVAALAERARELGISVPADRLVNSKPLNAIAASLDYVPFSGRAGTEGRMVEQLNRAVSRTMGQDTPNLTMAVRDAGRDLGAKFDTVLKGTDVAFDPQLLEDLARTFNTAERDLGSDALKPIGSQLDRLMEWGPEGRIPGQAAYNIKRDLDKLGKRSGPEAHHAREMRGNLMDALNRSLGPEAASDFATTRRQYGNMLALERLVPNGAEGEISAARLANLRGVRDDQLQQLADISAQFVRPREGQHGAMQRVLLGGLTAGATGGLPAIGAGVTVGRAANAALNSDALRSLLLRGEAAAQPAGVSVLDLLARPELQQLGYRAAPLGLADR